ncbi:thioredoxin reductase (NADPH) [Desulfobaculum xiamenense]|uniref:Thioredoxin reductase (NADPH) n=1 Tax=Desulfobaculum xiamenense TaxID=995050 RepID=A0A846QWQ6_9BACT|nr:FAD-dependent oxidoreductase [Desulfobaculum xiamenense]NJB69049.1 thioredoxin reductase (NADPH) [Desulfobaculum xiamenense]
MVEADKQGQGNEWFIPEESREYLGQVFGDLRDPVDIEVFTRDGDNAPYNEATVNFCRDLGRLSEKVRVSFHACDSERAGELDVDRSPTVVLNPGRVRIRYLGAPLGEEARTFIETITLLSAGQSRLSETSRKLLAELAGERHVRVLVSPTCPYCPGQVLNAFRAAIERPDLVTAECIETAENMDLAEKYEAASLPRTVINETFFQKGLYPEERFVVELVALRSADELLREDTHANAPESASGTDEKVDVVIVGGGPAGLTAAIYLERSGLKSVVLEKGVVGGQVALTPEVENYPGFKRVGGIQLMELIADQARGYGLVKEGDPVAEIKVGKDIEVFTERTHYVARAVILATGATSRRLGVPGEDELFGRGVSVCASCDGWAYKGKDVVMVGGGSSALTEALHLHNMGVRVTLVHRREDFRAEKHLQKSVEREGIPVLLNTVVEEFVGDDKGLSAVRLRNVTDGTQSELAVHGAFVAIGWRPETALAQQIGVKTDQWGYINVDRGMRTNIPRVYACGDVIGGVQQIVTAVGEGATAALSVFEDISNPYWKRDEEP